MIKLGFLIEGLFRKRDQDGICNGVCGEFDSEVDGGP